MLDSILVTFATRYGSTQETAETIASILREQGHAVDVRSLSEVRSLADYAAVIVGAPIYMLHWHSDALAFLARFQPALMQMPVAIFALGPFHDDAQERREARRQLDKELAKFPWLTPIEIEIFGGKFDPANLKFPLNLMPALRNMPASDVRDWRTIHEWANHLAAMFQPALAE